MNIRYRCFFRGMGEKVSVDIDPSKKRWICPECGAESFLINVQDISRFFLLLGNAICFGSIFFETCRNFLLTDESGELIPNEVAKHMLLLERGPLSSNDDAVEPFPWELVDGSLPV
jgi:hypothetical protein